MVVVPAGRFRMGSDTFKPFEHEKSINMRPQARAWGGAPFDVTIRSSFAVSKFEITFDQWDACVAAGGCGGYRPDDNAWGRKNRPVSNVNSHDAKSYVEWLGRHTGRRYRLLSEAEWEYAARGGRVTPYPRGSSMKAACESGNIGSSICIGKTAAGPTPVGSFPANAFGLYDTVGNVNEWVVDCWHGTFHGAPTDGSPWIRGGDCSRRVMRGGSWNNTRYQNVAASARWGYDIDFRGSNAGIGFRVALDLAH